ncbi:uncharacterized protein FOKN1_0512 [Thiohalobacter thiocyanaticus]|uniref:Uncharacterized protein n=1 Tax=Thiohalobacter thiocyanaticus TaxID=585455 RepID=A0A1Z4VMQ7_9GAMM|nr:hypothetical protein [Thiohalobacter thiocyanaticus]BAZ92916.1 uncharacterized protein FOKN1_0512 [Thiohalobacter thiocyanaticus]
MKGISLKRILPLALLLATMAHAETDHAPMPPVFNLETSPEQILERYPLGQIDRQAAFSHHGKAHRTVSLVNGLTGWVYEIHRGGKPETFRRPSGGEMTMLDTYDHPAARSYTLMFDGAGHVVDVLYRDLQHGGANSALLVQREAQGDSPSDAEFPPKK